MKNAAKLFRAASRHVMSCPGGRNKMSERRGYQGGAYASQICIRPNEGWPDP
jgi:hypothetical protein